MTHVSTGATYESLVDMPLLHEEDHVKKETKGEEKKEGLQAKKTDFKKGGKNNKPREKRR